MSRNDWAIEVIVREELKAMKGDPQQAETAAALKRILKNVKDDADISDEDWEVFQQVKQDFMEAIEDHT